MNIVYPLDAPRYKGFTLGWYKTSYGFGAAWRSSLEFRWSKSHVFVGCIHKVENLAHDCIDFVCRIEVEEIYLQRELTIDELRSLGEMS